MSVASASDPLGLAFAVSAENCSHDQQLGIGADIRMGVRAELASDPSRGQVMFTYGGAALISGMPRYGVTSPSSYWATSLGSSPICLST